MKFEVRTYEGSSYCNEKNISYFLKRFEINLDTVKNAIELNGELRGNSLYGEYLILEYVE
jgi:hypothetical protein